jgi:hypothetical protein
MQGMGLMQMGTPQAAQQPVQQPQYQQPALLPAQPSQMGTFQPHLNTPSSVQAAPVNQPYQMGQQPMQQQQQMGQQQMAQQQQQPAQYQQPQQQMPQQSQYLPPQWQGGYQNTAPPSWTPPQSQQPPWRDDPMMPPRRDYAREREMDEKTKVMEERARALEAQLQAAQLAQVKADHAADVEKQRQEHTRQLETLRAEIRHSSESAKKGDDDETKALKQQIDQQKAEFEKMRIAALQDQMRNQQESLSAQLKATQDAMKQLAEGGGGKKDDERFRLLEMQLQQEREENKRRQEDLLRERAVEKQARDLEREREKQDRDLERMRSEMKEQQARSEMMMKELAATVKESTASRPDPILEVMRANALTASEHQRQLADMQKLQIEKMAATQISPLELFRLLREQGSGNDGVFKTLMTSVGDIAGMYKNVAEHAIGLAGGGGNSNVVADMVGLGVNTVKEMADKYFSMKAATGVAEGKARQAEAMAAAQQAAASAQGQQAVAASHQAAAAAQQAAAERARMNAEAIRAASQQPPTRTTAGGGLSGAGPGSAPSNGSGGAQQQQPVPPVAQTRPEPTSETPPAAQPPPHPQPAVRPTDEQFFGGIPELIEAVGHLRDGVESGNLDPEKAVKVMLIGAGQVRAAKINCAAFQIFDDERWADFIDIMLPKASHEFQEACVNILAKEVSGEGGDEDEDETKVEEKPAQNDNTPPAEA